MNAPYRRCLEFKRSKKQAAVRRCTQPLESVANSLALIQMRAQLRVRVLQHRERQRREVLKDLRAAASAKSQSASPRKWKGKTSRGTSSHPTEGESSSGPVAVSR